MEQELRKQAIERHLKGESPKSIYRDLDRSKNWFFKWLKRYQSGEPNWSLNTLFNRCYSNPLIQFLRSFFIKAIIVRGMMACRADGAKNPMKRGALKDVWLRFRSCSSCLPSEITIYFTGADPV